MKDSADDFIEQIAAPLREPVILRSDFDAQVMKAVRAQKGGSSSIVLRMWDVIAAPRPVRVSPLAGFALAAAILVAVSITSRNQAFARGERHASVATPRSRADTVRLVQFVVVARDAKSVSLVGDFNDWNKKRTPLHLGGDGLWTVSIPLPNGRHQYAFMVNGERWMLDPSAPKAVESSYGSANSVVTVSADAL